MTYVEVSKLNWDFTSLINWLSECDVHFILAHVHQGGLEKMGWEIDKVYKYLEIKLFDHPGFPTGMQLRCPIFTQNKFDYLKPLIELHKDMSFVNKTMMVTLKTDGNYDHVLPELHR